jgi:hypothetical protein
MSDDPTDLLRTIRLALEVDNNVAAVKDARRLVERLEDDADECFRRGCTERRPDGVDYCSKDCYDRVAATEPRP